MSNLATRVITGVIFGVVLLSGILFNMYFFLGLFFLIAMLSLKEFYGLLKASDQHPQLFFGSLTGAFMAGCTVLYLGFERNAEIFLVLLPFIFILFIAELYRKKALPFSNIAQTLLGLVYVMLPFCLYMMLGFIMGPEYDFRLPLGFMLLLWASDTGAYFTGVRFGKKRLFERISPKKSWEGFFGGMICSLIMAAILSRYFNILTFWQWEIVALIVVTGGAFGDLVESLFKRSVDIKDSGSILPGHGGVLDRFDGLLLAAPFVFSYLMLLRLAGAI